MSDLHTIIQSHVQSAAYGISESGFQARAYNRMGAQVWVGLTRKDRAAAEEDARLILERAELARLTQIEAERDLAVAVER